VSRASDQGRVDWRRRRHAPHAPDERMFLPPGHLLVPAEPLGVGVVVTSTVLLTFYDPLLRRGGLCHFVRPRPVGAQRRTALFGTAAVPRLVAAFAGAERRLLIGLYGGACPAWATGPQHKLAAANLALACELLQHHRLAPAEADVGGERARKLWYHTGTNELLVLKTSSVRRTDWFPGLHPAGDRP
jgi:chemotaxis protein CheD